MKKYILLTLVTMLSATSAFAERETSQLQYVETASCSSAELARTIKETADRVLFDDTNLSVLESALRLTPSQKSSGIRAEISKSQMYSSSEKLHSKNVSKAEAMAASGRVGVTAPANFYVVYQVVDSAGQRVDSGHVDIGVACRVEKNLKGKVRHTAQLIDFAVKAKGVK